MATQCALQMILAVPLSALAPPVHIPPPLGDIIKSIMGFPVCSIALDRGSSSSSSSSEDDGHGGRRRKKKSLKDKIKEKLPDFTTTSLTLRQLQHLQVLLELTTRRKA
ncbi:hypothetical protein SLE2022_010780 [Rubroshorea leprosula]